MAGVSFAEPRVVDDIKSCNFYHRMELPGVGVIGDGGWDLRANIDDYLGRFDFRGKRVLDVGTASGFLTFSMEQRGGNVVSFDMADGAQWDVVPYIQRQPRMHEVRAECRESHHRLQNAYWFAHRRLKSRAKAFYGNIYDLPAALGPFDVALFGMILGHLRDPFQALYSVSRLVSSTIIITNQMPRNSVTASFMPAPENDLMAAWWFMGDRCLTQMLAVLGFRVVKMIDSKAKCLSPDRLGDIRVTAMIAERVAGTACAPAEQAA